MTVSVLLRLRTAALAEGRLVGRAELVDTGEQVLVRRTEDLVAYLRARALEPATPSSGSGDAPGPPAIGSGATVLGGDVAAP